MIQALLSYFKKPQDDYTPLLTTIEELKAINNYVLFEHEQTKHELELTKQQLAQLKKKNKRKKKPNTKTSNFLNQLHQPKESNES